MPSPREREARPGGPGTQHLPHPLLASRPARWGQRLGWKDTQRRPGGVSAGAPEKRHSGAAVSTQQRAGVARREEQKKERAPGHGIAGGGGGGVAEGTEGWTVREELNEKVQKHAVLSARPHEAPGRSRLPRGVLSEPLVSRREPTIGRKLSFLLLSPAS